MFPGTEVAHDKKLHLLLGVETMAELIYDDDDNFVNGEQPKRRRVSNEIALRVRPAGH